jgi:phytanoyl-CoA hydroxylase
MLPLVRRLPEPIKAPIRRQVVRYRERREPPETLTRRERWDRDGYLILPKLFDRTQVARGAKGFDDAWASRTTDDRSLVLDAFVTGGVPRRVRLADAPEAARTQVYKLNDMYLVDELVRSLILAEPLVEAIRELVDDDVVAINSLHFERGSTQQFHVDTYYMPPPTGGELIVSSICLEDVHPDAGPLKYYRGSHKISPYLNADGDRRVHNTEELGIATEYMLGMCDEFGLQPSTFLGRKGDTFLWHEQLLHGGTEIADMRRTRRSIVTHYWTKSTMPVGSDVVPWGAGYYLRRDHQSLT